MRKMVEWACEKHGTIVWTAATAKVYCAKCRAWLPPPADTEGEGKKR